MIREDAEQQSEHWQDIIDEKDALIEQQAGRLEELSKENYTLRHRSRTMSEAFHKDVTSMKALIEQQATQIAMADHAYQLLAEAHEQQAKKIARLREALEFVAGEASFLSEAEAVAKQALNEEHP